MTRWTTTCHRGWLAVLLGVALGVGGASHAASPGGLRHDPFHRPQPTAAGAAGSAASAAAPWQPELRGVMQAGDASMVNVGGSQVGLGESIDGWRLLRVEDGKAVFGQGARRTTLTMTNAGSPKK